MSNLFWLTDAQPAVHKRGQDDRRGPPDRPNERRNEHQAACRALRRWQSHCYFITAGQMSEPTGATGLRSSISERDDV